MFRMTKIKPRPRVTKEDARISQLIRFYRLQRGITHKELARFLGISIQQVQKYDTGTNRISTGILQKLVHKLEIPVWEIFQSDDSTIEFEAEPILKTTMLLATSFLHIKDENITAAIVHLVETIAGSKNK